VSTLFNGDMGPGGKLRWSANCPEFEIIENIKLGHRIVVLCAVNDGESIGRFRLVRCEDHIALVACSPQVRYAYMRQWKIKDPYDGHETIGEEIVGDQSVWDAFHSHVEEVA
jgi:hypothetical protein